MAVTPAQQERISVMRRAGVTYAAIAAHLELNANTVKTWCRRAGITPDPTTAPVDDPLGVWCLNCAAPITSHRPVKFCCEDCRRSWWRAHPEQGNRRAFYHFTCAHCATVFSAYGNSQRKYCTHACYIRHRFGTRGGKP